MLSNLEYILSLESICIMHMECNATPEGHDCDIMVGLLPWDPGMQHWPGNRNWNLALDVQVAASWQSERADAATNKDSSSFIVSSE